MCARNTQEQSTSEQLKSTKSCFILQEYDLCSHFLHQTTHQTDLVQQGHCKCSLLSDQTKQGRLHKHSCLAIKARSGAYPLLSAYTASTSPYSTLLSSSFEVVPRSSPPLASLPSAVPELLHYQPTAAAIIGKGTAG